MSALLTIAIVNYKTAALVCDVVETAKKQAAADGVGVHIVVVDNGSGDGNLEIIRTAHPDIELIDAGGNLGFARGNNLALRRLETPYAMLLNSDAFLQPGALRRLIDFMEENPDCGVAGPRILNPDGTDQDYPERFPSVTEMIRRSLKGPQFPAAGKDPRRPIPMPRIHGCCLITRRTVLDQVGLLDERFFMYDEDMDWCLRCGRAGWKMFLLPDAAAVHLGGQSSGRAPSGRRKQETVQSFNPRMSYELRKSRYILYRKHRGMLEILALKILTDSFLATGFLLSLPAILKGGQNRDMALKRIKSGCAIMAINPFGLEVDV